MPGGLQLPAICSKTSRSLKRRGRLVSLQKAVRVMTGSGWLRNETDWLRRHLRYSEHRQSWQSRSLYGTLQRTLNTRVARRWDLSCW